MVLHRPVELARLIRHQGGLAQTTPSIEDQSVGSKVIAAGVLGLRNDDGIGIGAVPNVWIKRWPPWVEAATSIQRCVTAYILTGETWLATHCHFPLGIFTHVSVQRT